MSLLTREEIFAAFGSSDGTWESAGRAVIAAYEAKLREQNDPIGVVKEDCNGFPWKRIGYTCETDLARLPEGTFVYEHPAPSAPEGLTVKLSKMEESNGNTTWSVFLAKSEDGKPWDWYQVYSDSIEGRAQYEADSLKHFLGQGPKPFILDYETDPPMAAARSE